MSRVFVPLRAADSDPTSASKGHEGPIRIVVEMRSDVARLIATFGVAFARREARVVQGLLRFGIHSGASERRGMQKLRAAVTDDCIVLQEGARPRATSAFVLLGEAAVAGVAAFLILRGDPSARPL